MTSETGPADEVGADSGARIGRGDALALAVVLAVAAFALRQSWGKCLHPVIDAGRDLYLATHLFRDATLYRDIAYVYPPLVPHLLAGITALFGSSLVVFATVGALTGIVAAGLLYLQSRRYAGIAGGLAGATVFTATCLAGATTYGSNFVFPYTYSATIGLALFLGFLYVLSRLVADGPGRGSFVAALLLGLAASMCKLEFALMVPATGLAAAVLLVVARRLALRRALRALAIAAVAFAVLVLALRAAFGPLFFASVLPDALLGGWVAKQFYARVTGSDQWQLNLMHASVGAALTALHAVIVVGIDRISSRERRRLADLAALALLLAALSVVIFVLANDRFFRGWLLIQAMLIPVAIADLLRARGADERARGVWLLMPLLLVAAATTTTRIWLNLSPVWFGFVFVVPVIPLIVDVLFRYLPLRGLYSRRAALLWLPLFIVISGRELELQSRAWARSVFTIETPRGSFTDTSPERARAINALLARVEELGVGELVVVPEGMTINYAAGVRTPLRINSFMPAEMPTAAHERAMIAEFESKAPRYVAVTTQEAAAYGFRGFGIDYGLELNRYLRAHYVLDRRWRSRTFSVFLLRRR